MLMPEQWLTHGQLLALVAQIGKNVHLTEALVLRSFRTTTSIAGYYPKMSVL